MILASFLIILSLVLLFFGAEWLVKGSSSMALKLGISPLIIGLTIVAFGTSAPELMVSVNSALNGTADIAVGNVVGSNIFNICLILGISSAVSPLLVKLQVLKVDSPISVVIAGLTLILFNDGMLSRLEGTFLFSIIVAYIILNIYLAKRERSQAMEYQFEEGLGAVNKSYVKDFMFVGLGLVLLMLGSDLLVDNAILIARHFGVSEAVIGLTIVAGGTSMPELATSLVAAIKKEADLAIGNIIGSNIFNIAGILGVASIITPLSTTGITTIDLTLMVAVGVLLQVFLMTKHTLERWEGHVLMFIFLGYMIWLWP